MLSLITLSCDNGITWGDNVTTWSDKFITPCDIDITSYLSIFFLVTNFSTPGEPMRVVGFFENSTWGAAHV
uniref:Uncharacterized protein n=1 Tax=Acrobeloides nanus TaxID=290746 RepID=A0A914D189_9BILA